ncbi:aminotransferase class V-fold PLP-dependent enzyme [Aceticella autotrophica]|uniref:cysteine desulfurase n=1 Tax=Aceticella autotrophica TaxID=2755338 RepID=A0A975AVA4_9THEO|nr:aminotransferase class V-fold PLP-dependent enzyme [Aceticella autotrophica]QSZ27096.1 aminotransferase class V-fold PLP-dependent enzyme [Aceticella autotrophica]
MSVYLDNAATSFPKPEVVYRAVDEFMRKIGVNAGRGAYRQALEADKIIYETRRNLAKLFNVKDVTRIIFTFNITDSINLALKGLLKSGDHVITSSMEHNAVWRPLKTIEKERGVSITAIPCDSNGVLDPQKVQDAITKRTKLIVLTHASNVTGTVMPIQDVGAVARENNVWFLVDAAQTAGLYPLDVEAMNIDLLAFTGHKGLMGPMGTGGLYIREGISIKPLREGGTGGDSILEYQPEFLPDRYEAGTPNVSGIAGLGAAVKFILNEGIEEIHKKETVLTNYALRKLSEIDKVKIYGPQSIIGRVGVISLNIGNLNPQKVGYTLDEKYGVMVRTGLHCAPCAHRTIGTINSGTIRIGLGYFNTEKDIDVFIDAIKDILNFV